MSDPGAEGPPQDPPPERSLTRADVERALRLASEAGLPSRAPDAGRPSAPIPADYTLEELAEAAREVGLDPALVRRAATLRPRSEPGIAPKLAGAPVVHAVGARLPRRPGAPAREKTPVSWDDGGAPSLRSLAPALDDALGRSGEVRVDREGRRLRWEAGSTHLVVERNGSDEEVAVTIRSDLLGRYLALLAGAGALTATGVQIAGGMAAVVGALGWLGAAAAVVGVPVLLARLAWTRWAPTLLREAEARALRVLTVVDEGLPGAGPPRPEPGEIADYGSESPDALPGSGGTTR